MQSVTRSTTVALPRRSRSRSQSAVQATTLHAANLPKPTQTQRATSYPESRALQAMPHRICIQYQDESLRLRSQANAKHLIQSALSCDDASTSSNSAILARKALKYRKVLDRMNGVDVNDPAFDASKFLGVDWCKTSTTVYAHPRKSYTTRQM